MIRLQTTYDIAGKPFWAEVQNRITGVWRLVICRRMRRGHWHYFWDEARPETFKTKREATAFKRQLKETNK